MANRSSISSNCPACRPKESYQRPRLPISSAASRSCRSRSAVYHVHIVTSVAHDASASCSLPLARHIVGNVESSGGSNTIQRKIQNAAM